MAHRKYLSLFLVACLAAFPLACGGQSEHPGADDTAAVKRVGADDLSSLCPDGALAFIRLNDVDKLDEEIANLARAGGADPQAVMQASLKTSLGQTIGNPGFDGVDPDRPIGVALFMGPTGEPAPIVFLPLSSEDDFQSALEASPNWEFMKDMVGVSYLDNWVAWAMDKSLVEGLGVREEPSALAKESLAGDISIALDMATLYEMLKPQLDQMMAPGAMPPGAVPGTEEMVTGMMEGMKTLLAESETLLISGTLDDGWLGLGGRFVAKEGSGIAGFLASSKPTETKMLPLIGTSGFCAMEMTFSGEGLWDMFGPFYEAMYAETAPELIEMMKSSFGMLDGMAMQMSFADGLSADSVSHLTDPAAYEGWLSEMLPKMEEIVAGAMPPGMNEMPISIETLDGWEHDGVKVYGMKMAMNFGEMPDMPPEATTFMNMFLGGEAMEIYYAIVGENAIQSMGPGGKQRIENLIDRAKAGETLDPSPVYERATQGFPAKVNGIGYMNLGDLAKLFSKMDMPGIDDGMRSRLESPPDDLWMSGYWATDGRALNFGMKMSVEEIVSYVRSFTD